VTDSVDSRAHAVQQLEIELNRVEDQVFEQFCREINVENIRQYEEGQLKIHEEHARQLREYHEQITRLKNQVGLALTDMPSIISAYDTTLIDIVGV
jgi:structural maintenance of chromosome 1